MLWGDYLQEEGIKIDVGEQYAGKEGELYWYENNPKFTFIDS